MENISESDKFNIRLAFLIGFGLFTTQIAWSVYNTQVNQLLYVYIASFAIVGILMALDNIIGIILQPIMGNISDNTRTKWGRRMPYLMIGVPLSALFFALIGTINPNQDPLWLLLLWIFCFITAMAFYRSQTLSLMADFIKPIHRSKGNAIINFMGGIGTGVAFILPSLLRSVQLTFYFVAVFMIFTLIILLLTVKEKNAFSYQLILSLQTHEESRLQPKKDKPSLRESFKDILSEKDKSTLFMLFAILALFIGYAGLEALFTVYAKVVLGLNEIQAPLMLVFILVSFLIMAYPSGIIATKIGRRLTIKIGLVLIIIAMILGFLIQTVTMIAIALIIAGIGWALVNINTIVIIWQMAPSERKIGTYTGVYLTFSYLAQILGPVLVGLLVDLLGNGTLLLDSMFFFIIALLLMFFVKRGEIPLTEEQKLVRQQAIQDIT